MRFIEGREIRTATDFELEQSDYLRQLRRRAFWLRVAAVALVAGLALAVGRCS